MTALLTVWKSDNLIISEIFWICLNASCADCLKIWNYLNDCLSDFLVKWCPDITWECLRMSEGLINWLSGSLKWSEKVLLSENVWKICSTDCLIAWNDLRMPEGLINQLSDKLKWPENILWSAVLKIWQSGFLSCWSSGGLMIWECLK